MTEQAKNPPVTIGIAVVLCGDRVLVGVRSAGQVLAGRAEFPGGRCEPGETPVECAVRECREETGLRVEPVELLERTRWEYAHASVDLHFWLCRLLDPEPPPAASGGFRWEPVAELDRFDFPEANRAVLRCLVERFCAG